MRIPETEINIFDLKTAFSFEREKAVIYFYEEIEERS